MDPNAKPKPEGEIEGNEDKPLTRAEVQELLGKTVNAAITSHNKRLDIAGQIAKAMEPFKALLPKVKPEGEETEEVGETVTEPGKVKTDAQQRAQQVQANPEIERLTKQVESLTRKAAETAKAQKDAETRALAAERKRVEDAGYSQLRTALTGKVLSGVEGDVVDIMRARGQVVITESGEVRLKLGGKDDPEDGHSLDDGLKAFVASPGAKHFLPAPTTTQNKPTGWRPGSGNAPAGKPDPVAAFEAKHGPIGSVLSQ